MLYKDQYNTISQLTPDWDNQPSNRAHIRAQRLPHTARNRTLHTPPSLVHVMPFRPPRGLPKGPGSATYPQRHRDNMQTEGCTSKGTCPDFPAHGNGRHREAETPRRLLRTPHTPVTIERP